MLSFRRHIVSYLCATALGLCSISHAALDANALRDILRGDSRAITDLEANLQELTADRETAKASRDSINQLRREIAHHKSEHNKMRAACLSLLKKVEKSRNINATDEQKRTLLMLVAGMGIDRATELVLAENPALEPIDKNKRLALDYERIGGGQAITTHLKTEWDKALADMQQERIEELLNCGADPNWAIITRDITGETTQEAPLVLALQAQQQDIFYLLLLCGASVETRNQHGIKIAELIVKQGNASALSSIMEKGAKTDIAFSDGRPMFEHLLAPGAEECLVTWLDKAEDKDSSASNLNLITRLGTQRAVEMAFSQNKDAINKEDAQSNLPLHEAARRGEATIYKALIQLGADPECTNLRGETALMHAALSGNADMLSTILQTASPSLLKARDEAGHSAIHYARLAKDAAAEQALKAAGLTPQPKD